MAAFKPSKVGIRLNSDGERTVKSPAKVGVRLGKERDPDHGFSMSKQERPGKVEDKTQRPPEEESSSERPPAGMACSLCGGSGHTAASHGSVAIRKKTQDDNIDHGTAAAQDRATQFGYNNGSPLTTGNPNYKSPGWAGGMT